MSKLKLNLVIPPNPYLGDDKRNPPLGLLYLAAVSEKAGYSISLTDLRGYNVESFSEKISSDFDVYGLTAATPDYPMAVAISKLIKQKNSAAITVLGGIHATSVPNSIDPIFDKVVIGEGERSLISLLKDVENKTEKRFYQSDSIKNLDEIPFPARHLLPFEAIFSKHAFQVNGDYAGTLITSRGCPNSCSFCASEAMWGKKVRFRSPENVYQELTQIISEYGVKQFRFQDDTMVLNKKRLEHLCNLMTPLGIKWRATTRVDHADINMLKLMKKAGCEELGFGIESLDQYVLDRNAKKIKLNQVHEALENTRISGLKSRLFFIIGLPGEKPGYAERLENFMEKESPDGVDVSTMVVYPGTDIYNHPEKYSLKIKNEDFNLYHMTLGLRPGEVDRIPTFIHDVLSPEQIIDERRKSLEVVKKYKAIKNF